MQRSTKFPTLRLTAREPKRPDTSGLLRLISERGLRLPAPPPIEDHTPDLIFRIHAHAARIGRTGPTPLICRGART